VFVATLKLVVEALVAATLVKVGEVEAVRVARAVVVETEINPLAEITL
jgi:hypothetical protein